MLNNKLAIIGANESISMLIKKAKDMGYETHVFAWKCGDPGEELADVFYPISIDKKEEILEKCKEIGVCGICSITSDFASPIVNYVSRKMGFPCNEEKTDVVARDKYEMRKAFKEAGVFVPPFQCVNAYTDSLSLDISYPVIVKPTDRWSSKGVTRVDNEKDLKKAIERAVEESFNQKAIIEGFMEGPEYSAECICFDGNVRILAFTKKETTGYPNYIETGHTQPSDISNESENIISKDIVKAIRALGIKNGAAHVEFRMIGKDKIGIIEIGARMGGDYIGTDLTPMSTGMDYIRMVIDVACGNEPCFEVVTKPSKVSVNFILNKDDFISFEESRKNNPDNIERYVVFDNNFEKSVIDSSTRHGYCITRQEK